MSGLHQIGGRRKPFKTGGSVAITVPDEGLDEHDIDRDALLETDVPVTVKEDGRMVVDLSSASENKVKNRQSSD